MELQNCMTDMLSTLASGFGDKALMLVDKDGTPAGHILGTEMVVAIEYEKYKRKFDHLPTGFVELEYLECTGTQYINLGISGNVTFNITAQCVTPSSSINQCLVCSTINGVGGSFFSALSNGKWGVGTGATSYYTSVNSTTKAEIVAVFNSSGVSGTINGESYSRSIVTNNGAWMLFALTNGTYQFKGKVWSLTAIKNNNIIMKLVPAMRSSDGEVGMFDLITGAFLTNAGTGSFNFKIKSPQGYTQLEYLESTGTQYLNLGMKWSYNISCEVECKLLSGSTTALAPIGARNSQAIVWGNYTTSNGSNYACFGDIVNKTFTQNMVDNTYHIWKNNNVGFYLDGVKKADVSGSNNALVSNDNICMFGRFDGSGATERLGNWAIKYGKIFDGSILIHFYVPTKRNSDNVVGMYDLVSNTFLTNAGSGTFSYGEL